MALVHSENEERWYFTKEELQKTPSVLSGMDTAKELSYRQQSASLIQDMGQRLTVSQLTINTAIVYMHRFYMFHSFSTVNRNVIAPCCLFLSAKLEEQPRKLEHVLKVAHACLHRDKDEDPLDTTSEKYLQQAQDLVMNESVLLQTLGFELTVDHPHTHVVRITQLVRASKDLAQTSYFMATNSLHLTAFCIEHKPSVVACVCIHLACKWSNWEFPRSSDNKDWWEYGDPTVTKQSLDNICQEFLNIIESCPSRLKRRINTVTIYKGGHRPRSLLDVKSTTVSKNGTSSKGETSSSRFVENNVDKPSECTEIKSDTTLTITSSAAVVETATSKVTLPTLPPLTTKYATITTSAANISKDTHSGSSSGKSSSGASKHKYREHDETGSPAKKMKTVHSSSSHGSSNVKYGIPGPSKHSSGSHHHQQRQQQHSSMKIPSKSSSSQNSHNQAHYKRHSGGHTSSHSGNKIPHKHSNSPLESKKSSGDRHKRPLSSGKPKPDVTTMTSTSVSRVNDTEEVKKDTTAAKEGFTSPPGPQRLPVLSKLPLLPNANTTASKHNYQKQPPLPADNQDAPPPPPPPCLPPPPPPPPT